MTIAVSVHVRPESTIRIGQAGRHPWVVVDDGTDTADLFFVGDDAAVIGTCERLVSAIQEVRDAAVERVRGTPLAGIEIHMTPGEIVTGGAFMPPITESEARLLDGNR